MNCGFYYGSLLPAEIIILLGIILSGVRISSTIIKKLLPIIFLIGLAAAWGYFGNDSLNIETKPVTEASNQTKEVEEPKDFQPVPQAIPEAIPNEANPPIINEMPTAENPYEQFMKAAQPKSLNDSLNSLNSGEIRDDQVIRRNEYFEKLSEQLKELQGNGGGPPPELEPQQEGEPELIVDKTGEEQPLIIGEPEINEEAISNEQNPFPEDEIPEYEIPTEQELITD